VIKFYPSKFVLVTEILDTFGKLVFERIKRRSVTYDSPTSPPKPLPGALLFPLSFLLLSNYYSRVLIKSLIAENFTSDMVAEHARETCRNWFFKIASIRELLPRM